MNWFKTACCQEKNKIYIQVSTSSIYMLMTKFTYCIAQYLYLLRNHSHSALDLFPDKKGKRVTILMHHIIIMVCLIHVTILHFSLIFKTVLKIEALVLFHLLLRKAGQKQEWICRQAQAIC